MDRHLDLVTLPSPSPKCRRLSALVARITLGWLLALSLVLNLHAAPPVITSFTPASGTVGTSVSISGTDLTTATVVRFNGVETTPTVFGTLLLAIVPAGATTGPITVVNPDGTGVSTVNFVVLAAPLPTIASFTPSSGAPGVRVSISGANLAGATVRFNGVLATEVTAIDTEISVVVPAGATSGPISVTTTGGTAATTTPFTVQAAALPVIQDFTPKTGRVGTFVTLSGQNFDGLVAVEFNGVAAVNPSLFGSQIVARVPVGATSGPIRVTTAGGSATSTTAFTVIADVPPVIASFAPSQGPVDSAVIITGTGLAGVNRVLFNGVEAKFDLPTATEIKAYVPTAATTGPITVRSTAGTNVSTASFTVTGPLPVISGFTPAGGPAGTVVVVSGAHLTNITAVAFAGVSATFTPVSASQLLAVAPAGASTGPITVTSGNGSGSSAQPFYAPPTLTSFQPAVAAPGQTVTLTGANLTGATSVKVGEIALTYTVVSATELRATVAEHAADGLLSVVTPGGTATSTTALQIGPSVRSFSPMAGQPGTLVRIHGTSIGSATNVTFGGARAILFTNIAPDEVHAVVPPTALTGPITVETPVGAAPSVENFQIGLEIQSFLPASGIAGSLVTIRGAGFSGITAVEINGLAAQFSVVSAAEIQATIPMAASSGPISIQSPSGTAFSRDSFGVVPYISKLNPGSGRPGDLIQIEGSGFLGVTDVEIGLVRTAFLVQSANSIRMTVPDTAVSAPVIVTGPAGVATSSSVFIIGVSADLELTVTATPANPAPDANVTFTLIVKNLGPNTATNAVVTNRFPVGAFFVSSFPAAAPSAANELVLPLGNIASGASTFASVVVKLAAAGSYTNTASVTAVPADPTPGNSTATTVVTAADPTPPTLSIAVAAAGQVQLSWPATASAYQLQSRPDVATGPWTVESTAPVEQNGQLTVTLPATGGMRYFRLARP